MAQLKSKLSISISDLAKYLELSESQVIDGVESLNIKPFKRGGKAHLRPDCVRRLHRHFGHRQDSKIVSVQMLKGGVSKTTTVLNLGLRARMYGLRVLLIDLDQQANLTYSLAAEQEKKPIWLDIIEGKSTVDEAKVVVEDGLHLITSNLDNSLLERVLTSGTRNIAACVSQYLKDVEPLYDLILLDTAPNLSAINTSVSCASDLILLPVNPDRFSFQGLQMTLDELDRIEKEFEASFHTRIVLTRYDGRESSSKEFLRACYNTYKERMLSSYVRASSDVKNTIRTGRTVFDSKSNAREDYDLLTREILKLEL